MQYRSNSEGHNERGDLVPKVLRWVRSYCPTKIRLKHNNPTFSIATPRDPEAAIGGRVIQYP